MPDANRNPYGLQPFRGTTLDHDAEQRLLLGDTETIEWHVLCARDPAFSLAMLRVRLVTTSLTDDGANLIVHRYGDQLVAEIAPDGTIVSRGISESLDVDIDESGSVTIDVTFFNLNDHVFVGLARDGVIYKGSGTQQYRLDEILIEPQRFPASDRINIVDVGAAGGLQPKWRRLADLITPTMFEPNAEEAERTRSTLAQAFPESRVLEHALSNIDGEKMLFVARDSSCSSILEPNPDVLRRYRAASIFENVGRIPLSCVRYDSLFHQGLAPRPDVIKIDVQGYEYEVLLGFGALLQGCLGVELESHLYPIYRNQKLLHDLVQLMADHGLFLRAIHPVPNFDGEVVEVDAFFTRDKDEVRRLGPVQQRKYDIINAVWGLPENWPYAES